MNQQPPPSYGGTRNFYVGVAPPVSTQTDHFPRVGEGATCIAGFLRAHHISHCPPGCCLAALDAAHQTPASTTGLPPEHEGPRQ